MYPLNDNYWQTLIQNKLHASSIRIRNYFDLILKNDVQGEKNITHLFKIENEELLFYKIPQEELKKFWESVKTTAFSYAEYTKAEEEELQDIFWKIYNNL